MPVALHVRLASLLTRSTFCLASTVGFGGSKTKRQQQEINTFGQQYLNQLNLSICFVYHYRPHCIFFIARKTNITSNDGHVSFIIISSTAP